LRYLGVERQLSPITLLNYQRQLDAIIALAGETGLQSWQQCDALMVRSFAVRSRRKGWGRRVWRCVSPRYAVSSTGWLIRAN
jgi:integrase/recombinase XerC